MDFLVELFQFFKSRRKIWLLPLVVFMVVLGGLLMLAQGSVLAPFIYTLF
jgi:hypothetical protein